ncbi:autotransporter-associated N-terminal domain-containing protein [Leptotrichia sp. oral taxon 847]|uniref:autotransporter-associated N-terminal domain-containing protein n=1 Tax=Leptotrichia sp. oral taxon 847 TaxID=1785996 RepID=UPI0007681D63|nr:autotransporter-associated N-terminal domain-containing protein [Leptotrichia sp. oral taxon 847]AMD95849.1 hypothetical protein AXF11_09855 [Leptotrichia sp. oral taxon 847]
MTNDLRILKKELKSFAKRVKDFKYTDSALITFLLTGLIMLSGISLNLYSDEIKAQQEAINTSITQIRKDFKRARQENNKLLRNTNLELIQLMEQGDQVVKSPWSSWQFGMNYVYNDWQGTYKGRGDKKESMKYARVNDKFGTYTGAKQGTTELKRVIEPVSAVPVDAAVRPKTVTINAVAGASAPVITTPTLNVNVSSVTPSTTTVPSITAPTVAIPGISMESINGYNLIFPNSGVYGTDIPHATDMTVSSSTGVKSSPVANPVVNSEQYISYFYSGQNVTKAGTKDATVTIKDDIIVDNFNGNNKYYAGGSRYAYTDDVFMAGTGTNRSSFTLQTQDKVTLRGPKIVALLAEETLWNAGYTDFNIKNKGTITDYNEGLSAGATLSSTTGNDTVKVDASGYSGYKTGIALTTEESDSWSQGHNNYNLQNDGTIEFYGSNSTGIQYDSTRESAYSYIGMFNEGNTFFRRENGSKSPIPGANINWWTTPITWGDGPAKVSLINANGSKIILHGDYSHALKMAGELVRYGTNDGTDSQFYNLGTITITGNNGSKGSSAAITKMTSKLTDTRGANDGGTTGVKLRGNYDSDDGDISDAIMQNKGTIEIAGYNNAGLLIESNNKDTTINASNGVINIDRDKNQNKKAASNAAIRVQASKIDPTQVTATTANYRDTSGTYTGSLNLSGIINVRTQAKVQGVNNGTINLLNSTDNGQQGGMETLVSMQ